MRKERDKQRERERYTKRELRCGRRDIHKSSEREEETTEVV
jgi:hypothetical protein